MRVSRQMENGWRHRLEKVRAGKGETGDVLSDLALDPRLPYRSGYEKRCQKAGISEEEFDAFYREGVEMALLCEAVAFFGFMDLVFSRVEEKVGAAEKAREGATA